MSLKLVKSVDESWSRYAKRRRYHENNPGGFFFFCIALRVLLVQRRSLRTSTSTATLIGSAKQRLPLLHSLRLLLSKALPWPLIGLKIPTWFEIFASNRGYETVYRYR